MKFKTRIAHGLMFFSMTAPIIAYTGSAFAQSNHPGAGNNSGNGGNDGDHGGNGGNGGKPNSPSQPSAPSQPAPPSKPSPPTHPAPPTPPAPGPSGPPQGGPHRPGQPNNGGNDVAIGIAAADATVGLINLIGGAIHSSEEKKVKSYDWRIAGDDQVYCFGINQFGDPAKGQNSVADAKCTTPFPVNYAMQADEDGNNQCYVFYTPSGNLLNNSEPVDPVQFCGQAATPPPSVDATQAANEAEYQQIIAPLLQYNAANPNTPIAIPADPFQTPAQQ